MSDETQQTQLERIIRGLKIALGDVNVEESQEANDLRRTIKNLLYCARITKLDYELQNKYQEELAEIKKKGAYFYFDFDETARVKEISIETFVNKKIVTRNYLFRCYEDLERAIKDWKYEFY